MPKLILADLGLREGRSPRYAQGKYANSWKFKLLIRSRAVMFTALALAGACMYVQATSAAGKNHKPEETAADFIAQFYGVTPDQVNVTIVNQQENVATALTKVPGQATCTLELALTPFSAAHYDWLVSGLACDEPQ